MSWFGYRSKSGYDEGSHSDYVKGRPVISYDDARGTHPYVTRIESRADTSYKHPTSHVMVDPSMEKYARPREVDEFITKILDEVNGAPNFPTILNLNPNPNQGQYSSPVEVYPTSDHGYDDFSVKSKIFGYHGDPYDYARRPPGPRKDYDVRNDRYFDQSHGKSETSKDYEAPRQWERSQHPLYDPPSQHELKDHGYPKNQRGYSSIEFRAPKDHEAPKRQRDKSSSHGHFPKFHEAPKRQWDKSSSHVNDGHFPKYQYEEMSKDHGIPSNHRFSSYDRSSPTGNGGLQFPDNYGLPINQHERSSSPLHDHSPPSGYIAGVPNSKWGHSLMKPHSPRGHGAPNKEWGRSSSPIHDYSPFTKSTNGVNNVPSNQWGDSLMNPQSPQGYRVSNDQWGRSSSPVYDPPLTTKSTGSVPSSRLGNSLMKPQYPKRRGVASDQLDRSSSPIYDHTPPTVSTGGVTRVPSSGWGHSSMKPQSPKGHGVPNNQWDRSSSSIHDPSLPTKSTGNVPSSRWGNSLMKPQSPKRHGVASDQLDRSSSPIHDHTPPTMSGSGWCHSSMKPESPKNHGVANNQWDQPSLVNDKTSPSMKTWGDPNVPTTKWGNSSVKPQPPKDHGPRSSNLVHDHYLPARNTGGALNAPNSRWGNSLMKPQPSNDRGVPNNQWNRSSSPVHDHPPLAKTTTGSPTRWGNNSMKPVSSKDHGAPNSQWDGSSNQIFVNDHPLPSNNRSSSPVHGHLPTQSTTGIPNSKLGNSSVKPQSSEKANNPYDEKTGNNSNSNNNNTHMNKPVGYTNYYHQPEEYRGRNNGMKPNGYSNPPKMDRASATQKPLTPDNLPDPRIQFSYPSSVGPKPESKVGLGYIDNAEPGKRYDGHNFPAKPSQVRT